EFATARVAMEGDASRFGSRQSELTRALLGDPGIAGVAVAIEPPGDEPWVFVDIEGRDAPTEAINGKLPGFLARFNRVDTAFFDLYQVPGVAGRRFNDSDAAAESSAVVINRNFAETISPGGNALGRRFRYVRAADSDSAQSPGRDRWYEVVGVVGNLPVTTDARVAYHATAAGQMHPVHVQLRLRGDQANLAERLRRVAANVDPTLHVDEVRTLAEIYRDHR